MIENLSGRKLFVIVGFLLTCQLFCFLVGGLMGKHFVIHHLNNPPNHIPRPAPIPSGVQTILATICKDIPGAHNDTNVWLFSRGDGQCQTVDTHSLDEMDIQMANRLVYVFQVNNNNNNRQIRYPKKMMIQKAKRSRRRRTKWAR